MSKDKITPKDPTPRNPIRKTGKGKNSENLKKLFRSEWKSIKEIEKKRKENLLKHNK